MLRTVIVMDYQNVHLTAHDIFNRQSSKHYALIHPMQFAETAIRRRNELQREGYPHAVLKKVTVFRGLPHVDYDWEQHRRCTAQADQWRRDGAIVELRDLKYSFQMTATGLPATDANHRKIPIGPGVEKGSCATGQVRRRKSATDTSPSHLEHQPGPFLIRGFTRPQRLHLTLVRTVSRPSLSLATDGDILRGRA